MSCHEDRCPVKTKVQELLTGPDSPDQTAQIKGNSKEKQLPPGRSFFRVTQLFGGTPEDIVGVRVIHRRPTGLQEIHVHTHKPAEMLAYLATALIG